MANSSTVSRSKLIATIDTTGTTDPITVTGSKLVDFALNVDGSWNGTIDVQGEYAVGSSNANAWHNIASYTADTVKVFSSGSTRRMRINATVTAGSCALELTAGNRQV